MNSTLAVLLSKYLFIYELLGSFGCRCTLSATPKNQLWRVLLIRQHGRNSFKGMTELRMRCLRFAAADVALATCSGISTFPKLLITPRKVTEVQSDPANIADLAKWCQSHVGRAKVIHV